MAELFDCSDSANLLSAARAARQAIGSGRLVVMPTDTVYGVAADAFNPEAVQRLLDAKGRGRHSPPPVLIANTDTLAALAAEVVDPVRTLAEHFWPGPLTIVLNANPSLAWDLGETAGTVALRIPDHPLALELLRETGPLAVSSANSTGEPAAQSASEAQRMLGDSVAVYLDAGAPDTDADGDADGDRTDATPAKTTLPSTIVDATGLTADGGTLRVLREGALARERIADVLPQVTIEP